MEEMKTQILERIGQILNMDLGKLYPRTSSAQSWGGLSVEDTERVVLITRSLLEDIRSNPIALDSSSVLDLRPLRDALDRFVSEYINNSLPSLTLDQITSQHHGALNQIVAISSQIRSSGIYADLNAAKVAESVLKQKVEQLAEAEGLARMLSTNASVVHEASETAHKWLNARRDVNGKTIEEQAEAFHDMATEHKVFRGWSNRSETNSPSDSIPRFLQNALALTKGFRGSWWWLFLSFTFAFFTALITYQFIILSATDTGTIGFGNALLKITSLVVPAYLTLFCSNQFLFHKRLYNNYMFKYSAMRTMNNLVSTHKEKEDTILEKGLDILFTEPKGKEASGKYDSQMVTELIRMLREQMSK